MEQQTLKVTSVLSDPTRFSIYQYITKIHRDVTVQEIADAFDIHPNVARLHLSKLEDVHMLISETQKTGKGGRPSRLYRLSDEVITLQFPFRDYQLLAKLALETLSGLGEHGKKALFETGKKFGLQMSEQKVATGNISLQTLTIEEKVSLFESIAFSQGISPEIHFNKENDSIHFEIHNCPFKEIASLEHQEICSLHQSVILGILEFIFQSYELHQEDNMLDHSKACTYTILVKNKENY